MPPQLEQILEGVRSHPCVAREGMREREDQKQDEPGQGRQRRYAERLGRRAVVRRRAGLRVTGYPSGLQKPAGRKAGLDWAPGRGGRRERQRAPRRRVLAGPGGLQKAMRGGSTTL